MNVGLAVVVALASAFAAIPLRIRVVRRLKTIGRHEEFGSPPAFWAQPNLLPLQLVLRLRGRVDASDWRLFLAYLAVTLVTIVAFVTAIWLMRFN